MFALSLPNLAHQLLLKASLHIKTRMVESCAGVGVETGFGEKCLALSAKSDTMCWLADSVYGVLVMGG